MNTLIMYDSTFGNTEQLARAMADRLGAYRMVILFRVPETGALEIKDADVLIMGGPTQRHGASEESVDMPGCESGSETKNAMSVLVLSTIRLV